MDEETGILPYESKGFEELRQVNVHGAEYWEARHLQRLLGYEQWRSLEKAIRKAMTSCTQSGNEAGDHFARATRSSAGRVPEIARVPDHGYTFRPRFRKMDKNIYDLSVLS